MPLGDGLALTGNDGEIVLVNQRCAEMFGYERKELIGRPVDSLVPFGVQAAHEGYRAAYTQAPRARPMGERARLAGLRKDGATLPVEISLSPVPTATDNFVRTVAAATRCKSARSRAVPTGPNGGRYEPVNVSKVACPRWPGL